VVLIILRAHILKTKEEGASSDCQMNS